MVFKQCKTKHLRGLTIKNFLQKEEDIFFIGKRSFSFFKQDLNQEIGINQLYTLKQVHNDGIVFVQSKRDLANNNERVVIENKDAFLIKRGHYLKGRAFLIKTADCLPIAIISSNYIALIHAGWRGLRKNIILKVLNIVLRQDKSDSLRAFIFPSAGRCCYQIQNDLRDIFIDYKDMIIERDSVLLLDIKEIAKTQLCQGGLVENNIYISNICTICSSNFYSFRREKSKKDSNFLIYKVI